MPRVIRAEEATTNPRAECLGDDPDRDAPTNCAERWPYGRRTLENVKDHIRNNPTHDVIVIRETRSLYRMGD
jgi:hypothetical protein